MVLRNKDIRAAVIVEVGVSPPWGNTFDVDGAETQPRGGNQYVIIFPEVSQEYARSGRAPAKATISRRNQSSTVRLLPQDQRRFLEVHAKYAMWTDYEN